jgi:hypothetical protein
VTSTEHLLRFTSQVLAREKRTLMSARKQVLLAGRKWADVSAEKKRFVDK